MKKAPNGAGSIRAVAFRTGGYDYAVVFMNLSLVKTIKKLELKGRQSVGGVLAGAPGRMTVSIIALDEIRRKIKKGLRGKGSNSLSSFFREA